MNALVALLGGWRATVFAVLAVAAVVTCFLFAWRYRAVDARADAAESRAVAAEAAVEAAENVIRTERRKAKEFEAIAQQHEQDKLDAKDKADRTVADLRAGNERLRDHWQGCQATGELSAATAAARESDAAEQRRIQGASDLVRLAAEWDAKERRLQEVIRKDREP